MGQTYKNVYFSDLPSKRSLTIAFGPDDSDLYESLRSLSSQDIRSLLGYDNYGDIKYAAERENISVTALIAVNYTTMVFYTIM